MAENDQTEQTREEATQSGADTRFVIQKVYLKDCSLECPNSPEVFSTQWEPQISVNLNTTVSELSGDTREVVLRVTVEAKKDNNTAFLAELHQAGIFTLTTDFTAEELRRFLAVECPGMLFPYAREAVADLISKGGFPPLLLQAVNFEQLYKRAISEAGSEGAGTEST